MAPAPPASYTTVNDPPNPVGAWRVRDGYVCGYRQLYGWMDGLVGGWMDDPGWADG